MENTGLGSYLRGLLDLASSLSVWMGPSYVVPVVFENETFGEDLKKYCGLDEESLQPSGLSFGDFTYLLFGYEDKADKNVSDTLMYFIKKKFGEPSRIRLLKEDCFDIIEKKSSPFPFTAAEEAAAVEFEKYTVFFVTGNNE